MGELDSDLGEVPSTGLGRTYGMSAGLGRKVLERCLVTDGSWVHRDGKTRDFYLNLYRLVLGVDPGSDPEAIEVADQLTNTIGSAVLEASKINEVNWSVFMPDMQLFTRDVSKVSGLPASVFSQNRLMPSRAIKPFPPQGSHPVVITSLMFTGREIEDTLTTLWSHEVRGVTALSVFASRAAHDLLASYEVPLITLSGVDAEELSAAA